MALLIFVCFLFQTLLLYNLNVLNHCIHLRHSLKFLHFTPIRTYVDPWWNIYDRPFVSPVAVLILVLLFLLAVFTIVEGQADIGFHVFVTTHRKSAVCNDYRISSRFICSPAVLFTLTEPFVKFASHCFIGEILFLKLAATLAVFPYTITNETRISMKKCVNDHVITLPQAPSAT